VSRTRHLTRAEFVGDVLRPRRRRAPTRLTKIWPAYRHPNVDRPRNNGAWPGGIGFNAGQRRRREAREDKLLGRRRERRRLNREVLGGKAL